MQYKIIKNSGLTNFFIRITISTVKHQTSEYPTTGP